MKLHLGCGNDYKEGWVNVDFINEVKADVYHDLNKFPYPFIDDSVDYLLMDNVLEHLPETIKVMEEIHRISKPGATIEIIVPLAPTMFAFRDPTHVKFFTYRSMDYFTEEDGLNFYSKARFKIKERKIIFHHKIRFLNGIINSNELLRKFICEFMSQLMPPTLISFKLKS